MRNILPKGKDIDWLKGKNEHLVKKMNKKTVFCDCHLQEKENTFLNILNNIIIVKIKISNLSYLRNLSCKKKRKTIYFLKTCHAKKKKKNIWEV